MSDLAQDQSLSSHGVRFFSLSTQYADKFLAQKPCPASEDHVLVSRKVFASEDFGALVASSLNGWFTAGRFTADFERQLA